MKKGSSRDEEIDYSKRDMETTEGLVDVIEKGGSIAYRQDSIGDKQFVRVRARRHTGELVRVYTPRAANDKIFTTIHSLCLFHRRYFPNDKEIVIPVEPGVWSREYSKQS